VSRLHVDNRLIRQTLDPLRINRLLELFRVGSTWGSFFLCFPR